MLPYEWGREEGAASSGVCCIAGDETEGLDLEERRKNEDLKLSYLLSWPACFSGRRARWVGMPAGLGAEMME